MTSETEDIIGPVLVLDRIEAGMLHLAALFIAPEGAAPGPVAANGARHPALRIADYPGATVYRARFGLPADRPSAYEWGGRRFDVASDMTGDLRIAYVSCNGEEHGDLRRDGAERNAMWAEVGEDHARAPFSLLLHGGDQIYADEATHGHDLSETWPDEIPRDPSRADLAGLRHHLRTRFLERYATLYRAPEFARVAARVPSLMQWDDHDICDGWGSLPRSRTYSPVGQTLFSVAREAFLTFQHAAAEGDLPGRFADPSGIHLGWSVEAPGLRILAPDLRSERTRREIMGPGGWAMVEAEAARPFTGRTLLMSSVPLLGPRLSLLETLMVLIPKMQKYEDDLRDQWQSRAHRDSWRRMLRLVCDMARAEGQEITAISGEIHLAARAEMKLDHGHVLHQLVASGIAHRPPPESWPRILGALASLGEDPLPAHPIRIARIPGQPRRYVAERNYLVLERRGARWSAAWQLERSGRSPDLDI